LGASPAAIECFDILSLFGDSEVTSQLDRLNSSDTYRVEWSPCLRAKSWLRVLSVGRIGFLLATQSTTPHPTKAKTQAGGVGAPGIFIMCLWKRGTYAKSTCRGRIQIAQQDHHGNHDSFGRRRKPNEGLRDFLREKIGDLSERWFRRGFNRGHRESYRECEDKGKVPRTLTFDCRRKLSPRQIRALTLKSTIKKKSQKSKGSVPKKKRP
jgi:hypothetical protein